MLGKVSTNSNQVWNFYIDFSMEKNSVFHAVGSCKLLESTNLTVIIWPSASTVTVDTVTVTAGVETSSSNSIVVMVTMLIQGRSAMLPIVVRSWGNEIGTELLIYGPSAFTF